MVNNKMCVCVRGSEADNVMVRVGADAYEDALQRKGASPTIMKDNLSKAMYLGVEGRKNLRTWVELTLEFNKTMVNKKK